MKAYEKMKAVIFDISDSLDEAVAWRSLVPAGAGAGFGGNVRMDTTFGLDEKGVIGGSDNKYVSLMGAS